MTNCVGCVNLRVNNSTNIHYCQLDNTFCKVKYDTKIDMLPNGVAKLSVSKIIPEKDCNTYESDWNN